MRLFGAKSVIAQRGVTTRAANKQAEAKGQPPVRGKLAKKARRLKSAAATLAAAGQTVTLPAATTPVVQVSAGTSSPVVASGAPVGAAVTAASPAASGPTHS